MSANSGDAAGKPDPLAGRARSLAVAGLALTSAGLVLTFAPWAGVEVGAVPADAAVLFGFTAPVLGIVVLVGCGCSVAATFVAGRVGSPATSLLGFGGFVLAIGYAAALWVTGMHSIVVGSAASGVTAAASSMMGL